MTRLEMFEVVKRNLVAVVDGADRKVIREEGSLADYGADSLEIVEVVSRSMKDLGLKVKRTELTEVSNVSGLLDLFEAAARRAQ